jgi:hypothetical protein
VLHYVHDIPLLDEFGSCDVLGGRANTVVHAVRSARVLFRSNSTVDRDREPLSLEAIKKQAIAHSAIARVSHSRRQRQTKPMPVYFIMDSFFVAAGDDESVIA